MILKIALIALLVIPFHESCAQGAPGKPTMHDLQKAREEQLKGISEEWIEFRSSEKRNFKANVGILYQVTKKGEVNIEVASLATGEGAESRKWKVIDTKLLAGSRRLRPESYNEIYGTKESLFRMPATVVFTAIGAAYGAYGNRCTSGGSCHVTGQEHARGGTARGIDTVGMAVSLGLLASQARGEITGQKALFKLDPETASTITGVKLTVEHIGSGKRSRVTVSIEKLPEGLRKEFNEFAVMHKGVEHRGGVKKGGTFLPDAGTSPEGSDR
ncbi:MAG: hypothetical protein GF409_01515 [Candidatus Omnitrophica bacterium]|nr:hypothetical protein [Candidatus Omnitrophota bacterium]